MKTNTNSKYLIAVLIDGDNVSFERMEDIMGFVSRYGDAVIRRIYGDWTRKALSGWKETAREYGFRLVQASSYASGKNTTDIALVIDAMDILRDGRWTVSVWSPVTVTTTRWRNGYGRRD